MTIAEARKGSLTKAVELGFGADERRTRHVRSAFKLSSRVKSQFARWEEVKNY